MIRRPTSIRTVPRMHALVACALLALHGAALLHQADPHAHGDDDHAGCTTGCAPVAPADADHPGDSPEAPGDDRHDCGLCLLFGAPATPAWAIALPSTRTSGFLAPREEAAQAVSHLDTAAAPRAPPHSLA